MDLFEESERVKIRLLAAFDRLHEKGLLTEAEWEAVLELLDTMDSLEPAELAERVQALRGAVAKRMGEPA